MKIDGNREFELLKKFGFTRLAGSEEELAAANILKAEAESLGVETSLESFEITDADLVQAELEVLEPYNKKYTVTAYKCSGNVTDLVADFIYVENGNEVALKNAKGKIVLINGYLRLPAYRRLIEAGVAGFITMSGSLRDKEEKNDLFVRMLRKNLRAFGEIPGLNIHISDAFEMITKKASKVRMTTETHEKTLTSHNVIATIPGTTYPDEIISFGAHYDSVEFSSGTSDNGAGSVIIMELLRYFAANPPARTLKFMWYGSEEIGLEGSKAYIRMHEEELDKHLLMINVDIAGLVLGSETCFVTASKDLTTYINMFMKVKGHEISVSQSIYSSDCVPYADKGVPAVNFVRGGTDGSAFIHSRYDNLDTMSADAFVTTTTIVRDFAEHVVNAVVFPEKKQVPPEMVEAVDKYLFKKELAEAEAMKAQK